MLSPLLAEISFVSCLKVKVRSFHKENIGKVQSFSQPNRMQRSSIICQCRCRVGRQGNALGQSQMSLLLILCACFALPLPMRILCIQPTIHRASVSLGSDSLFRVHLSTCLCRKRFSSALARFLLHFCIVFVCVSLRLLKFMLRTHTTTATTTLAQFVMRLRSGISQNM